MIKESTTVYEKLLCTIATLITSLLVLFILFSAAHNKYLDYQELTGYNLSLQQKESYLEQALLMKKYDKALFLSSQYGIYQDDIKEIIHIYKTHPNRVLYLRNIINISAY